MKTKSLAGRFFGGAWAGIFLLAAGCSDGVLPTEGGTSPAENPPVPPVILSFMADPTLVDVGGSTMLSWEVTGADKVEITSTSVSNKFNFSTEEAFKSSVVDAAIQEDTTFILTATKMPGTAAVEGTEEGATPVAGQQVAPPVPVAPETPGAEGTEEGATPEETGVQSAVVTAEVTVKVRGSGLKIVSFYADAPQGEEGNYNSAGEKIVLQWSVVPTGATVSLSADTGETIVLVDCGEKVTTTKEMELEGEAEVPAEAGYPAVGCATVQPTQLTTYTLEARMGEEVASQTLTVQVEQGLKVEYFTVNGSAETKVSAYPAQVNLAWKVLPFNAKVTILAEPSITGAELPSGSNETEGTMSVTVAGDTKLTLKAVLGEEVEPVEVEVKSDMMALNNVCSQLDVSADAAFAFVGETVTLRWQPPATPLLKTVSVMDGGAQVGTADVKAGSVQVPVSSGTYTVVFKSETADVCSKDKTVPVAVLKPESEKKALRVVKDTVSPEGVYVGFEYVGSESDPSEYNGGIVEAGYYKPSAEIMSIPFKALLGGTLGEPFLKGVVKTFPVNAVAVSPATNRLFVATTGAITHRGSDGKWGALPPLLLSDSKKEYKGGKHATCFGKEQTGMNPSDGRVVSMKQVCDLAATADGKLYAATDFGLMVFEDIEAYIANTKSDSGFRSRYEGNPFYKSVVNDVELAGNTVYAAGARGVYRTSEGGSSWESIGEGISGEAYSVAVSTGGIDSYMVAVGTNEGLYLREFGMVESTWRKVESVSGKVYSVSFADGALYAGTDAGLYVSRNDGNSFVKVPLSSEGDPVVRSVLAFKNESNYYVYVATEAGLWSAYVKVPAVTAPPVPYAPPPAPPTQPESPVGDEEDFGAGGSVAE